MVSFNVVSECANGPRQRVQQRDLEPEFAHSPAPYKRGGAISCGSRAGQASFGEWCHFLSPVWRCYRMRQNAFSGAPKHVKQERSIIVVIVAWAC